MRPFCLERSKVCKPLNKALHSRAGHRSPVSAVLFRTQAKIKEVESDQYFLAWGCTLQSNEFDGLWVKMISIFNL